MSMIELVHILQNVVLSSTLDVEVARNGHHHGNKVTVGALGLGAPVWCTFDRYTVPTVTFGAPIW